MLIRQLSKRCSTLTFVSSILLALPLITSCSNGNDSNNRKDGPGAVREGIVAPKRIAYPRVEPYADTLKTITFDKLLKVNVNALAAIDIKHIEGSSWITVEYPRYKALIYCTLTPADGEDEIAKILDNRLERIGLNAGGYKTTLTDIPNPEGIHTFLYTTAESRTTPLQFVAVAENSVFSGSVFFNNVKETAPLDSLSPMVENIKRDLTSLLSTLSYED